MNETFFRSNYHSHNIFCDGRAAMEDFIRFAIAKGLKKYGFSSHAPLPFHTSWNMNLEDLTAYREEFFRLKNKYSNQIELYLGLEIDYIHGIFDANSNLYSTDDFEYKIGSLHYLDPLPDGGYFSVDGSAEKFKRNLKLIYHNDIKTLVLRYFTIMKEMLMKGGFDVVGHVDKISLNGMLVNGFNINESWYEQEMDEILQIVRQKGYILEINTKSFLEKGITYPDVKFFPIIKTMQIPVILSSDCHYPDKIIEGFDSVYLLMKKAGIENIVQMSNNGWIKC